MFRYMCVVAYDGSNYMGFQIQKELPTIEKEIKNAVFQMLGVEVKIYPSGRTDRGVHAVHQVFHFDLDKKISPKGIKNGMNTFLPKDIFIREVHLVSEDFHARFSCISKEYHYFIYTKEYNPFYRNYALQLRGLDIDKMVNAISLLEGTHNFKGFASASIDKRKDTIKTIYSAKIIRKNDFLEIVFIGNGFLKYQIRRMVGLLIEIGRGKETEEKIKEVLEKGDPKISHKVADGCGLYLYNVVYGEER